MYQRGCHTWPNNVISRGTLTRQLVRFSMPSGDERYFKFPSEPTRFPFDVYLALSYKVILHQDQGEYESF